MKYKLESVTRKGNTATLTFYCPDCLFAHPITVVEKQLVFMDYYNLPEGETKAKDLPKELRETEIHGETIRMKLPGLFVKMYTEDVYDELDKYIVHHRGEVVCGYDGNVILHEYMDVHCFWTYDTDTTARVYLFGTPEQRMYHQLTHDGWVPQPNPEPWMPKPTLEPQLA